VAMNNENKIYPAAEKYASARSGGQTGGSNAVVSAVAGLIKSLNFRALLSVVILCAVIVLFSVLAARMWDAKDAEFGAGKSYMFANATANHIIDKRKTESEVLDSAVKSVPVTAARPVEPKAEPEAPKVAQKPRPRIGPVTIDKGRSDLEIGPDHDIVGSLTLQNMNKFVLPCGLHINGDLIIRNVRIVRFCDGLSVSGNILVSSDSSFGPLPKDAKILGQIVL